MDERAFGEMSFFVSGPTPLLQEGIECIITDTGGVSEKVPYTTLVRASTDQSHHITAE
jgi:hypothetical protein